MKKQISFLIILLGFLLSNQVVLAEEPQKSQSLYQLTSKWQDQNGQQRQLNSFAGKPVILTMGYTGCAHACPLIISKIKSVEKELASKKISSYQVVFVSFDTIKDRPADLKKYLAKKDLDSQVWTMMSGSQEDSVRELANVLGINYKDVGDGDFVHSNVITVLDGQGNVISHIDNLNADIKPLVQSLESLSSGGNHGK